MEGSWLRNVDFGTTQLFRSQLAIPAACTLLALLAFILLLAKQKADSKSTPQVVQKQALDANAGTVFVEEDGHIVRRSTRARKQPDIIVPSSPVKTPGKTKEAAVAKTTPKVTPEPVVNGTGHAAPAKTPTAVTRSTRSSSAPAAEPTPEVEEAPSPKARTRRVPRA